jgi:hypothetical protein
MFGFFSRVCLGMFVCLFVCLTKLTEMICLFRRVASTRASSTVSCARCDGVFRRSRRCSMRRRSVKRCMR